jgi:hypothetical protein
LARAVIEAGWDLNELRPASMSLEEIFLQLTGADAAAPGEEAKPGEAAVSDEAAAPSADAATDETVPEGSEPNAAEEPHA